MTATMLPKSQKLRTLHNSAILCKSYIISPSTFFSTKNSNQIALRKKLHKKNKIKPV